MAEIFRDPFIQKHSKVSAVRRVHDEKQHFINFGHNFFKPGELKPTFVWRENKRIPNKQAIFTSLDDFQGYEFNVSLTENENKTCKPVGTGWSTALVPPRPGRQGGGPRGRPGHLHQLLGVRDRTAEEYEQQTELQVRSMAERDLCSMTREVCFQVQLQ